MEGEDSDDLTEVSLPDTISEDTKDSVDPERLHEAAIRDRQKIDMFTQLEPGWYGMLCKHRIPIALGHYFCKIKMTNGYILLDHCKKRV